MVALTMANVGTVVLDAVDFYNCANHCMQVWQPTKVINVTTDDMTKYNDIKVVHDISRKRYINKIIENSRGAKNKKENIMK